VWLIFDVRQKCAWSMRHLTRQRNWKARCRSGRSAAFFARNAGQSFRSSPPWKKKSRRVCALWSRVGRNWWRCASLSFWPEPRRVGRRFGCCIPAAPTRSTLLRRAHFAVVHWKRRVRSSVPTVWWTGTIRRVRDLSETCASSDERAEPGATANTYACHIPCLRTACAKHTCGWSLTLA
jgi:hypothetical protein